MGNQFTIYSAIARTYFRVEKSCISSAQIFTIQSIYYYPVFIKKKYFCSFAKLGTGYNIIYYIPLNYVNKQTQGFLGLHMSNPPHEIKIVVVLIIISYPDRPAPGIKYFFIKTTIGKIST